MTMKPSVDGVDGEAVLFCLQTVAGSKFFYSQEALSVELPFEESAIWLEEFF